MALTPKQQKLLAALRQLEGSKERLPRRELVERLVRETGYKEVSTYLSKYLESVVVKGADDMMEARGVLAMSEDDFAALLTQKRLTGETRITQYQTREEWVEVVRHLLEYGAKHAYFLEAEDRALVEQVLPARQRSLPGL